MTRRRPALPALALAAATVTASLLGCAQTPAPEETIEQLTSVTQEPASPTAAEQYDAELHPEPTVEPLECSAYLLVTVRGTGEPKKKQLLSPVARAIVAARPGQVTRLDLDYPADVDVNEGGTAGVRTLIDTLNVQQEACPEQRFVLLGYSQGALIIGDALSAPVNRLVGETVGSVRGEALSQVLAVVLYGDPRFAAGEPYNAGTFVEGVSGLLPRPFGSLSPLNDRVRDYCVEHDFVCQSLLEPAVDEYDEEGHIEYYSNGMQQDGAAWVITKLDPLTPSPTPAPSAPATPAR